MAERGNDGILRLAVPAILTNITVPLLGLCDTAISGHLGHASFIGGISVGSMILNSIYWLFTFLRMGTTGLTATAYGTGSREAVMTVLRRALTIGAVVAVLMLLFREPLLRLMLWLTHPDPEVEALAARYFSICVWTAPAQLATMAITGWFIGMQTTVVPMMIAIGTNVVNIAASLLLVFVWDYGFTGIAVGTLVAQYAGVAGAACFAWHRSRSHCARTGGKGSWSRPGETGSEDSFGWGKFFSVNTDLFFRSAFMIAVSMTMTSVAARIGQNELAANAVGVQFWLLFSYFMDGFAFAAEALVGRYTGASDVRGRRRVVRRLLFWAASMGALFFVIYLAGFGSIVGLLTDVESVRLTADTLRPWITLLPPITVAAFIFDGIFVGLTRTRDMLLSTLLGCVAFFLIAFVRTGGVSIPGNRMLWTAFEAYLLIRGLYLSARYAAISVRTRTAP